MKRARLLVVWAFLTGPVLAAQDSDAPLSADDWEQVMEKVALLEDSGLMPSLLPTIMRNRDALQLRDEQVSAFRGWRNRNYSRMVTIMNEIIEKKVQFRIESLSTGVSSDELLALQAEIHALKRQLLDVKLSCRELLMATFTDKQWENFAFVVSDDPKLASLFSQLKTTDSEHVH